MNYQIRLPVIQIQNNIISNSKSINSKRSISPKFKRNKKYSLEFSLLKNDYQRIKVCFIRQIRI